MRYLHDCDLQQLVNVRTENLPRSAESATFMVRCHECKQRWLVKWRRGDWRATRAGLHKKLKVKS